MFKSCSVLLRFLRSHIAQTRNATAKAPRGRPTPTPIAVSRYNWDLYVAGAAGLDALQDGEIAVREVVALGVEVLELVGKDVVEELSLDDDDEGLLLAMAARAPRPATGVASGSVKGEPTSHTG